MAPWDVLPASITKGVSIIAANCWGCQQLGRKNHYGMPAISDENRKVNAWKRFSNMVGVKGMRVKQRANWINVAMGATRRVLEWRAKQGLPAQTAAAALPACNRCGDPETGSRLLFAATNGGPIMAARCDACGGSGLYVHSVTPERPPLEVASGDHWKPYGEVFEAKFDRIQMVAAAVKRTHKAILAKGTGESPSNAVTPAADPPPEPDLDDELPI